MGKRCAECGREESRFMHTVKKLDDGRYHKEDVCPECFKEILEGNL